jgi:hypothetical protein
VIASPDDVQQAVKGFEDPDVEAPKVANAAALGRRLKGTGPAPSRTTITVLNGNGVAGAAANLAYQLRERGYRTVDPPNGRPADAPRRMFHSKIYYGRQPNALAAAQALQRLLQPADVEPKPRLTALRALDPGSMVVVVVGQTFHGDLPPVQRRTVVKRAAPYVRVDRAPGDELLKPLRPKLRFTLMVPTVLERTSTADSTKPVRMYWVKDGHKAVRLVFHTGANEYWGVEETDWVDAPALSDNSFRHVLADGRTYDFYYSGAKLHMVVLRANGASFWVVNTLLDALSNETMIAIAKGLKPLPRG